MHGQHRLGLAGPGTTPPGSTSVSFRERRQEQCDAALFLITLLVLSAGALLHGQETRGTIVGRVTDATGAVIQNADVQVVSKAMGTIVSLKSNQEGLFVAPLLIPGMYQVSVTAPGFKKSVRENVELRVSDRIEVNTMLEMGTAEQSIVVVENAALLATETASNGSVITSRQIMDMPLSYGNPFALIGISAARGLWAVLGWTGRSSQPHCQLHGERNTRRPQRHHAGRGAEHGHGQRRRSDRLLCAADRHSSRVQSTDNDVRRLDGQQRGRGDD